MPPDAPDPSRVTRLEIMPHARFLPVLTGFVEQSVAAVGLGPAEARALTLAAEELLGYLTRCAASDRPLRVACAGQDHQVNLTIDLDPGALSLRWFNLTSRPVVDLDQDDLSAEIGLVIAARVVDRLLLSRVGDTLRLDLIKERVYPDPPPASNVAPAGPAVACRSPDGAELALALSVLRDQYGPSLPRDAAHPARMRDMIAAGAWQAVLAVDAAERLCGLLVWRWTSDRVVECLGPWLFDEQPPDTARLLLNDLLGRLARSACVGLVNRHDASALPDGFFETLGTLTRSSVGGERAPVEMPVRYRHLAEDAGAVVWTGSRLRPFLQEAFDRMAFARDLYDLPAQGGDAAGSDAVLAVDSDRAAGSVTLRPLWWGPDAPAVVSDHVALLRREGWPDILCELDLGQSWQARFGPALLDAGFAPRLVIPDGGRGDLLVLQHAGRDGS
jgi:hypothetical protein